MANPWRQKSLRTAWYASAFAVLLLVGGLVAAGRFADLDPLRATLVGICGSITLVASIFAIESLSRGEGLQFDSHWGGLGGGMGGWRVSPNATLSLVALIFLAATFAAAGVDLTAAEDETANNSADSQSDNGADADTDNQADEGTGAPAALNRSVPAALPPAARQAANTSAGAGP